MICKDYKRCSSFTREKNCFYIRLCIDQQWRRKKLGERLFKACESWAKEQNAEEIGLNVWSFNKPAIQLYESMEMKDIYRQMRKSL
ncbi:GNAT family N-acetyltransferase [Virgibacillus sp. DJP39]|uniref:GNAT family N-acetyltransferase n=1 Tax=Virgibacillus sp. DJP39 TaxID=3409790 RepID=UPI003BB6A75E